MDELFHCNYKRCKVILNSTAWIGSCSHIFCDDHCPYGGVCPVCSSALNTDFGLIKTNLNPPEEKRSMILAGFIPTKILNIGGKALEFWKFQLIQDKIYSQSKVHYLQSCQAQGKSSYEAMTQRLNSCIEEQAQKYEEIQSKMIIYIKRTQELEQKIKIKNQQLMNAHMHLESLWKQKPVQDIHSIEGTPSSSRQFQTNSVSQMRMCESLQSAQNRASSVGLRQMRDKYPHEVTAIGSRAGSVGPRQMPDKNLHEVTTSTTKRFQPSSESPRRMRDKYPHEVTRRAGSVGPRQMRDKYPHEVTASGLRAGSVGPRQMRDKHLHEVTTSTTKRFQTSSETPRRMRDNHPHEVTRSGSRAGSVGPRRDSPRVSSSQQPPGTNRFHSLFNKGYNRYHESSRFPFQNY